MLDFLPAGSSAYIPDVLEAHAEMVARALVCLPIAAGLGAALAFRPRRSGTPPRSAPVIQTQIILAIVGAMIMLIVGSSVARAFGVVGAASLIRYRAEIKDPKDAVVMLTSLTLGLATGVDLFGLALFGTAFILIVLWVVESLEAEYQKTFELSIGAADPSAVRSDVEEVLRRYHLRFELRATGANQLAYEVQLPTSTRIDKVSNALLRVTKGDEQAVKWEEPKKKT